MNNKETIKTIEKDNKNTNIITPTNNENRERLYNLTNLLMESA
jgi:hypothetical protein